MALISSAPRTRAGPFVFQPPPRTRCVSCEGACHVVPSPHVGEGTTWHRSSHHLRCICVRVSTCVHALARKQDERIGSSHRGCEPCFCQRMRLCLRPSETSVAASLIG